jgi:hypothetical protein
MLIYFPLNKKPKILFLTLLALKDFLMIVRVPIFYDSSYKNSEKTKMCPFSLDEVLENASFHKL